MRRIIGRVEVDGDAMGTATQPLGMAMDHAGGQRLTYAIELLGADGVLKARQRGLRSQIAARDRIAVEQHLVNGIGRQTGRVVGVRITAGNREHALRQQLAHAMIDLARLPCVAQTSSQSFNQSVAAIGRLQQHGSAIGTALPLIELDYGGLGKNLGEQQTRCRAIVNHAEASLVASTAV